jgi:hypothetical protein
MKIAHLALRKVLCTLVSIGDSNALHSTRSLAYTRTASLTREHNLNDFDSNLGFVKEINVHKFGIKKKMPSGKTEEKNNVEYFRNNNACVFWLFVADYGCKKHQVKNCKINELRLYPAYHSGVYSRNTCKGANASV